MKHFMMLLIMVMFTTILLYATNPPANLEITHNGINVHLDWDAVSGATSYKVYSCEDPYGLYTEDETGTFLTPTSWTKPEPASKMFYQVTALSGQLPVNLGMAADFVILAETGISTVPNSVITGNIGVSPNAASSITGFSLIMDSSGIFSTSTQVVGRVFAADYSFPAANILTSAVGDMLTAYNDAAGRVNPDYLNLGEGNISGLTLAPGLYKWGTGVLLTSAVTLSGTADDVWIFQIGEGVTFGTGANVILAGGAKPENIIWQAAGVVALGTAAHMEGIVLGATAITLGTGATINGRLLAQTAVTLDQSTVTQPSPSSKSFLQILGLQN
jgi:hypothetical protein